MNPPALVFDFGNVLAFFDYARACERLGRPFGLTGEDLLARARSRGLADLVQRYESGRITTRAFTASAPALFELPIEPDEFARAWVEVFWLNEPIARLVRYLKQSGHRLILGSNTNALHADHYRRQFADALANFDRLVLSHEVGQMKPSPVFYRACVEAAERPPAECVFIDDLFDNVEGARAAGLQAIHFRDLPSLVQELKASGVEIPGHDLARLTHPGHVP